MDPLTSARRGVSPMIERAVMLLPEPDSPTTPRTCPGAIENDTPRTASTTPSSVGIWTERSATASTARGDADPSGGRATGPLTATR